jgi:hypothetical protein
VKIAIAFPILLACAACNKGINVPPNTPDDVGGALACVLTDVIAQKPVDDCIAQYGQKIVADILGTLADSKQFAAEHPDAAQFAHEQYRAREP